jgi:hypothetical protein
MLMNGHTAPAETLSTVAEPIAPADLEAFMRLHAADDAARLCQMVAELNEYAETLAATGRKARALSAQFCPSVYSKGAEAVVILTRHVVAQLRIHKIQPGV